MTTNITFLILLTMTFLVFGCAPKAANDNLHARMDHNTMPMNHNGMDHGNMDHSTMASSTNAPSAPYDLQFLDTMIAHHRGAVDMAAPCETEAEHAELKTLCTNIISSQQKEIDQMKSWREKWFSAAAPAINMEMAGMKDSMKGMDMKKLGALAASDFDLEFIKQMIPHHEGAVIMGSEALQKSTKDEIKILSNAIIKAQETEIKQMKEWQAAWSK